MKAIIRRLDWVNEKIGTAISWFTLVLAVVIGIDVCVRYVFKFTYIWITELEIYFFAFVFLLASGYTFQYDKHVRVDVFYAKMTEKRKAWMNILGGVFLLIPWCYVVIVSSWYYGYSSFLMNESSAQPGGLPAVFVLKFCITLGFVFVLVQGISQILKSCMIIFNKSK